MTLLQPVDVETIHAYLDHQLDPEERAAFEARLSREPELRAALEAEQRLRVDLRVRLRQTRAPVALRANIEAGLGASALPAFTRWQHFVTWLSTPQLIRPALAVAYTLLLVVAWSGITIWLNWTSVPVEDHLVFQQLADRHIIYLEDSVPLDVGDKPAEIDRWFEGYVPFTIPTIPVLNGWKLEGGRLGEFHQQAAVHLVYDQEGRHISLTMFAPRSTDFPADTRRRLGEDDFFIGTAEQHPVILWRIGEVGYALVGPPTLTPDALLTIASDVTRQLHQ